MEFKDSKSVNDSDFVKTKKKSKLCSNMRSTKKPSLPSILGLRMKWLSVKLIAVRDSTLML